MVGKIRTSVTFLKRNAGRIMPFVRGYAGVLVALLALGVTACEPPKREHRDISTEDMARVERMFNACMSSGRSSASDCEWAVRRLNENR